MSFTSFRRLECGQKGSSCVSQTTEEEKRVGCKKSHAIVLYLFPLHDSGFKVGPRFWICLPLRRLILGHDNKKNPYYPLDPIAVFFFLYCGVASQGFWIKCKTSKFWFGEFWFWKKKKKNPKDPLSGIGSEDELRMLLLWSGCLNFKCGSARLQRCENHV